MEREATGERTREAIGHINRMGYFFGKVPYGKRAVKAPDNPRYRILVPDEEEQKVLAQIKSLLDSGIGPTQAAAILNEQKVAPPQGEVWTMSLVYNFKRRLGWHIARAHNARTHTDQEVKARMTELRNSGRTYQQVANILNEEGYVPLKGRKFTESSGKMCQSAPDAAAAVELAKRAVGREDLIVVTGSFYLVSEVRGLMGVK